MDFSDQITSLKQLVASGIASDLLCPQAVRIIQSYDDRFNWVGIYMLRGENLVLPDQYYIGLASEHTQIPLNQGMCGAAATERKTLVVDNVREDPRYLACSIYTQSEIVVPILYKQTLYGVLDLDSDTQAAFQTREIHFLESAAELLGSYFAQK